MKKRKGILILLLAVLLLVPAVRADAEAQVPYDSYNYDYWGDMVFTPAAYVPDGSISGASLGCGAFSGPQDLFLENGNLYVADTGNNRIVVLDSDQKLERVIESFEGPAGPDGFQAPKGVCVTADGTVYVADSGNKRIVQLSADGALVRIVENPTGDVLPENFDFVPLKVTVDYAGRIYCIAENMYQGIMTFSGDGEFNGFTGTINVVLTPSEILWLKLSTKEQRSRQKLYIATEFTGMDIDREGFLYATNIDNEGKQSVRLLNPKGQDVIVKQEIKNLSGDLSWRITGDYSGASRIVDVVERGKGIYSIMDYTRGRIFTYDSEGNLLYIFGSVGTQEGTFRTPSAIESDGSEVLVLDSGRNEILKFNPTRYGQLINEAVGLRYDGDEEQAVEKWHEVLKYNSDFELAYVGIGKASLAAGDNKAAMKYLRLGMDKDYYSIAYKRFRNEFLAAYLPWVLTGGVILIFGLALGKKLRKRRLGAVGGKQGGVLPVRAQKGRLSYAVYTMLHPGDGFYEIRHRGKGSIPLAFVFVVLFSVSFSVNKRYANFIVNPNNTMWTNSLTDLIAVLLFFLLFCVANWSITCLMEGEGRLKDILTVTGYSTLPMVAAFIPMTLLSYVIAADEEAFYYVFLAFSVVWFAVLLLKGIMTVHNFSLGKTLATLFLTFVAMVIIIFVVVLLSTILQQLYLFFKSIYIELMFSV